MSTVPSTLVDDLGSSRRQRLAAAQLYLVCDSIPGSTGDLAAVVRGAITGGVSIVQLRDKGLSDDELTAVANATRALCERLGALLIVNDRPNVAVAAGVDGVHVGQEDMDVDTVRGIVGEEMLIGLSTHTPAQIDHAKAADYIGVGPIFQTPTKQGRAPVGLDLVEYAAVHATVPFFAIGGIHVANLDDVIGAGADRVAVVRAIADSDDPEGAATELASRLKEAHGGAR